MATLLLLKNYDRYAVVNDDTYETIGSACPLNGRLGPYRVTSAVGPADQSRVGTFSSLSEVIPAFLKHYEKVQRWEYCSASEHRKFTLNVHLEVKSDAQGNWLAYRDSRPLLRGDEPARFETSAAARQAAETHELDFIPNAPVVDDGLAWVPDPELDWRSVPYLVEDRAGWERKASTYLP